MIGKNLKELRKKNKTTQKELADYLQVSPKTISSWESDRTEPNMKNVELICRKLNCLKTDLIGQDHVSYILISDKEEKELIKKYREADATTKEMIERMLLFAIIKKEKDDNNENN